MNKEWLSDYDAKEIEEYQKFLKDFAKSGKIEYPVKSRFRKLSYPIVDTTTNIWSLIPFYGSSLIHLHPCTQESMIEMTGWGTDADVNNSIQLSKDTGRAQFILDKGPLDYEPYDYLEPILKELRPPVIKLIPELLFDKMEYKNSKNEYDTLSGYKFLPYLKAQFEQLQNSDLNYPTFNNFSFKYRLDYATLKLSGYSEVAGKILDSMIDDPALALHYLHFFGAILATPKHNSFNISYNPVFAIDREMLRQEIDEISNLTHDSSAQHLDSDLQKQVIISDIGELLINKITPGTEGYLGCMSLIDKYKQQDLHKLLNAIQKGVKRKKVDIVKSNTRELSTVLDNIWKDTQISKLSSGISFGVPLLLGTIGPLAAQQIGGIGGLLAALGFRALDKKITPILSEKLAKIVHSDYLVAIYEFKKKYYIKD